jgi:hypothetical protein
MKLLCAPIESASRIFILVPDPNFKGTHKHFEKKVNYINHFFVLIPLLIIQGYFLLKPPPVRLSFKFGYFFKRFGITKSFKSLLHLY